MFLITRDVTSCPHTRKTETVYKRELESLNHDKIILFN
jgi:hypothetical protein